MYKNNTYIFNRSVRFRKWSRKAYAAFSSIHMQVSIGHVCKSIADSAISKSGFYCLYVNSQTFKSDTGLTSDAGDVSMLPWGNSCMVENAVSMNAVSGTWNSTALPCRACKEGAVLYCIKSAFIASDHIYTGFFTRDLYTSNIYTGPDNLGFYNSRLSGPVYFIKQPLYVRHKY